MRRATLRRTGLVASLVVAFALSSGVLAKDEPDLSAAIAGATPAERIAKARELEKTAIDDLVKAFDALGSRKVKRGDDVSADVAFLADYALEQPARILRLLAIDAATRLDREGFAALMRARADGEDRTRSALAAEALGLSGGKDDVPHLLELAKSPSISIAVRACEAVARIGTKKDAEAMMAIALTHEDPEVGDHAAWAAQDLLKTQKALLGKMKKLAGKDPAAPEALRYASLEAMLADSPEPFTWAEDSLERVRALALEAPADVTINARDGKHKEHAEATLAWIKENLPGHMLIVRAGADSIDVPGDPVGEHIYWDKNAIGIPYSYTAQAPSKLAYHVIRVATVLFDKRVGHPYKGHRGWENAIFDSFDVCEPAKLYNVGKGGPNRDQFMLEILSQRPWGTY